MNEYQKNKSPYQHRQSVDATRPSHAKENTASNRKSLQATNHSSQKKYFSVSKRSLTPTRDNAENAKEASQQQQVLNEVLKNPFLKEGYSKITNQ